MLKVVIVEDETLVRKGLVLTTPWEEYESRIVGEAENGLEGLELITTLKPDLVITDVRMPGLDGIQMIEQLKKKVDTEFIILSGFSEFEYAKNAIRLGVREYLIKPVDDLELKESIFKISRIVEEKKRIQTLEQHLETSDDSKIVFFREYILQHNGEPDVIEKCIEYIQTHYAHEISIKQAAESTGVSESHLSRLFKRKTSYTFNDYLTNYRMKQACLLLLDPNIRVYEVAEQVGYRNQRYFSVLFKRIVGMSPGEFRNLND